MINHVDNQSSDRTLVFLIMGAPSASPVRATARRRSSRSRGWRAVVSYGMPAVWICCTPSNVFLQRRGGSVDDLRQEADREGGGVPCVAEL